MKVKEIRELSAEELQSKIADARKEIVALRFQHATLKLESQVKLRMARRDIARLLTVETERRKEV